MNNTERMKAFRRPAFQNSYYIKFLLSQGEYPSLQSVIDYERYSMENDDPIKVIRLGKSIVAVQDSLLDPKLFNYMPNREYQYHWHSDPPYLKYPDPTVFTKVWTIAI